MTGTDRRGSRDLPASEQEARERRGRLFERVQTWVARQSWSVTATSPADDAVPRVVVCDAGGERLVIRLLTSVRPPRGDLLAFIDEARSQTDCIVVTDTERTARQLQRLFESPYERRTADGLRLYPTSHRVVLSNGRVSVWKASAPELWWELTNSNRLRLNAGTDALATGHRGAVAELAEQSTPRMQPHDASDRSGVATVYSVSGARIDTLSATIGGASDWVSVTEPFLPSASSYRPGLYVPDGAGLRLFR